MSLSLVKHEYNPVLFCVCMCVSVNVWSSIPSVIPKKFCIGNAALGEKQANNTYELRNVRVLFQFLTWLWIEPLHIFSFTFLFILQTFFILEWTLEVSFQQSVFLCQKEKLFSKIATDHNYLSAGCHLYPKGLLGVGRRGNAFIVVAFDDSHC